MNNIYIELLKMFVKPFHSHFTQVYLTGRQKITFEGFHAIFFKNSGFLAHIFNKVWTNLLISRTFFNNLKGFGNLLTQLLKGFRLHFQ